MVHSDSEYIYIPMGLFESGVWHKRLPYTRPMAFIDILKWGMLTSGILVTSLAKLSIRWGWPSGEVLDFLKYLQAQKLCEVKKVREGLIVSIVNYQSYFEV